MSLTPHHAKYIAFDLTRRVVTGMDRLSMALFDAAVDLNPHQIEAALFALQSPLSKGVVLADEVGLGKTIEAGIVLCQFWAERKRRLLVRHSVEGRAIAIAGRLSWTFCHYRRTRDGCWHPAVESGRANADLAKNV